jgi:hypothetical protein
MDKKIFFLLSVAAVALSLSGCFAGVETRSGWHMVSLPPSSGKRLAAECNLAKAVENMSNANVRSLVEYQKSKDGQKIIDLQMENAALRAANNHLLGKD